MASHGPQSPRTQFKHNPHNELERSEPDSRTPESGSSGTILSQTFGWGLSSPPKGSLGVTRSQWGSSRHTVQDLLEMTQDQLSTVLDQLPDDASLTLTVTELRGLIRGVDDTELTDATKDGPEKAFYSSKEVASRYGISDKTLRRKRHSGLFPGAMLQGRDWLYPVSSLRAYERWLVEEAERKAKESPAEKVSPDPEPEDAPDLSLLKGWENEDRTHDG
jgi:helix-turn-helix protein